MTTEIKPGIHWVGAVDWESSVFHGHELSIPRGSSYNAYLILDEKIALVDSVWTPFSQVLVDNIRSLIDPARIDYIITNHSEIDHSGALTTLRELAPKAELLVSRKGLDSVSGHFHADWPLKAVQTGDALPLGKYTLRFIEATMLHWPDSMFTYVDGADLLLSNDAFGQHYAAAFRFNDEVDPVELQHEALKYYANILTPFSPLVLKKIDEILALNLPVDMIAPSHGIIWRKDAFQIVKQYQEWASLQPEARAVVIYDTMWQATRRMADAIGEGLAEGGVEHRIYHASTSDRNELLVEIFRSRALIFGSPTWNNGLLPAIWPLLHDLKSLRFKNKIGGAFGAYGWSGEGPGLIEAQFDVCKIPHPVPAPRCKWRPDAEALAECRAFGRAMAEQVKAGT